MERDRSYRGIIAQKIPVNTMIPAKEYRDKNEHKSWHYGQHTKYNLNFICISKDGTLGEIWKVGDLYLGLPSSEGKEILNLGKSDDLSKWERTKIPREFIALERDYKRDMKKIKGLKRNDIKKKYNLDKKLLETQYGDFIDKEFDRRKNGIFIKIDNEIIYLTGENYMFLNYYYLAEDKMYPDFRITATHTYWHWEGCVADTRVWGELRLKSRRVAWTVESCSMALNKFTITKYAEIPVVSETDRLAKKLFTSKIVNSFKYYPTYFKPLLDDPNTDAKSGLEIYFDTDDRENSVISTYPTKLVAYDSTKATFSINDEVGKWEDVSFTEFRGNHEDCHKKGDDIVSTGRFGSTAGAYSNGGEEFEYEFQKADATKRNELGSTETGLISLFVDECYTFAGKFDEWGYPIVFDPKEPILNENGKITEFGAITTWKVKEEEKKKGLKTDHNNFLRQHPRTIQHAFRSEGGMRNNFDIDNLNNHADYLEDMIDYDRAQIVKRGNLEYTGEKFTSPVRWIPNTKGKFQTTWIPDEDLQNKASIRDFHGKPTMMPDNNFIGAFGVDSYDIIGDTIDNKGSDGSIVGFTKMNMIGAPSQSFFLIYKERPDKRDDFFDDVIMACQFWGFFALIESNKARLLEYMYDNGCTGYAMRRQDKKYKDLTDAEKIWGGIPSSTQVIEDQASLLKDYIMDYVGQNLENDCKVYFPELIKEWTNFNLKKRKEFDLGVASGMAKMGAQYEVRQRKVVNMNQTGELSFADFSA